MPTANATFTAQEAASSSARTFKVFMSSDSGQMAITSAGCAAATARSRRSRSKTSNRSG
jgi:hypothetical protein